jgi:cytochrome P450
VVATPGEIEVVLADPATASDVLARRKDFDKDEKATIMDIFGPNVLTAGNEAWPRYRRLTVPPFSERCSSFVWRQSLLQSSWMLKAWISQGRRGVDAVAGTMKATLHVLVSVGLGKTHGFEEETIKRHGNHKMWYMEALQQLLAKIHIAAVVHLLRLPNYILPGKMKEVACAMREFRVYIEEMMEAKSRLVVGIEEARENNLLCPLEFMGRKWKRWAL